MLLAHIYPPETDQIVLYTVLLEAAKECGDGPVGGRALGIIRVEKGYGSLCRENFQEYWRQEAGLTSLIKLDKDFPHKEACLSRTKHPVKCCPSTNWT